MENQANLNTSKAVVGENNTEVNSLPVKSSRKRSGPSDTSNNKVSWLLSYVCYIDWLLLIIIKLILKTTVGENSSSIAVNLATSKAVAGENNTEVNSVPVKTSRKRSAPSDASTSKVSRWFIIIMCVILIDY